MQKIFALAASALLVSMQSFAAPMVDIKTNHGEFTVELYPDKAPLTVANFLRYVNDGFYNGTIFHRVINRFMIQGGALTPDLTPKLTYEAIPNEATNGLLNKPGTIAMARAYSPDSATSQFFINVEDNKFLNHYKPEPDYFGYAVFGKVVKGMDVVKKIAAVATAPAGSFASDVPVQPVIMESVSLTPEPPPVKAEPLKPKAPVKKPRPAKKSSSKKSTPKQ